MASTLASARTTGYWGVRGFGFGFVTSVGESVIFGFRVWGFREFKGLGVWGFEDVQIWKK